MIVFVVVVVVVVVTADAAAAAAASEPACIRRYVTRARLKAVCDQHSFTYLTFCQISHSSIYYYAKCSYENIYLIN